MLIESLVRPVPPCVPEMSAAEVWVRFRDMPGLPALAVVDGDKRPIGLIGRGALAEFLLERGDLAAVMPLRSFMRKNPPLADINTAVGLIREQLAALPEDRFAPDLVATNNGRYVGILAGRDLLIADCAAREKISGRILEALRQTEAALEEKRAIVARAATRLPWPQSLDEEKTISLPTHDGREEGELLERLDRLLAEIAAHDHALLQMATAAESANDAKSQFLSSMSHELRTPLNAILGYSEILEEDLAAAGMAVAQSDAERIQRAAKRLLHMINEILDLSKIEAGRMQVSPTNFGIADLIADAIETLRPIATKTNCTIEADIDPALGVAYTDSFKLSQCLLNLLSNACKFSRDSEILLRAARQRTNNRDWLVISVADQGIGMAPADCANVFQPFVQADSSSTKSFAGTGLGLSITRRLAQLLGGDISVASELGAGSTFVLRLPARYGEPQIVEAETAPARPIVLMIHPDAEMRRQAAEALELMGFSFREAETGAHGLAAVNEIAPALVLLNMDLPDLSGWAVLQTLKSANAAAFDIPVLAMSEATDRRRALGAGACEHLALPLAREALASAAARYARYGERSPPRAGEVRQFG